MKQLLLLSVFLFTMFFSYTVVAQELGSLRKGYEVSFPEKIQKLVLDPLPAGTYTIGTGGYFPAIDSAFNKLNVDGVAGAVTLELINTLYVAPADSFGFKLVGPIPGVGPSSRVTIKPTANKNVSIEGNGHSVLSFLNTSYVTIDGVALTGAITLTIHAQYNPQFQLNSGVVFFNNSDHNVVQNVTVISEDYLGGGQSIGFFTQSSFTAADSNLIQNNFIKKANVGIVVSSGYDSVRATSNIIRGNIIGSETDSLIAWGILLAGTQNSIVENNVIQNLRNSIGFPRNRTIGINSYCGSGDIIRNNIVHNIKANGGSSIGILLSADFEVGSANSIYNNMVYDIRTAAWYDGEVAGIQMWSQNNPKIYYNSVYLTGNGGGSDYISTSGALYINYDCENVEVKNNLLINTRDESPGCASAIYIQYSPSILTSDYNDLFYEPNQYNAIVKIGGTMYNTLADWQAMGKDLHSVTEIPNFIAPNLHIDFNIPTGIESHATPITGITTDFDGELRNTTTPDIGADEFNGIVVGIKDETPLPINYTLEQNYPNPFNPSTKIKYSIPKSSQVTLKIFNTLGENIETLVNSEKAVGTYELNWNASNLPSGVYFYRLQAGDFVETKKMVLLK